MSVYCTSCYFCYELEPYEDLECTHGNAVPENGAPEEIGGEPHDCPFFVTK